MVPDIEIRPAEVSDIPEVARLVAALAAYEEALDERARYDWDEIRDAPNWLRTVLSRDHHAVWVADSGNGRLAGHLSTTRNTGPTKSTKRIPLNCQG